MTLKTKGNLIHISQLKKHPQADIIPQMRKDEWDDFYTDIAMAGIREEIEILADGTIMDGHHRLKAAQKLGIEWLPWKPAPLNNDTPLDYMLKAALLRRHLTDAQRQAMAVLWKKENKQEPEEGERDDKGRFKPSPHYRGEGKNKNPTATKATEMFNVSRRGIDELTTMAKSEPDLFNQVHSGKTSMRNARKEVKKREQERNLNKAKAQAPTVSLNEKYKLIVGDFREKCLEIPDNSIDLILTDPPYGADYKDIYSDLAGIAERVLKDGASLLVMTGVMFLPEIFPMFSNLHYNWTIAYLLPSASARVFPARVFQGWKPILWFTKGKYNGDWSSDVIRPAPPDKQFHKWQQSTADFEQPIRYLCPSTGTVLDPMVGWGATAIACFNLNKTLEHMRKFIGIDISQDNISVVRSRLKGG